MSACAADVMVILKFGVSGALLYLLLRGHDPAHLFEVIQRADWPLLAIAAGIYWCVALPSALRWSIVVRLLGYTLRFGRSLLLILVGYFFNQTLLSSIGGDGMRMWMVYRAGLPGAVSVVGVLIDRIMQYVAHMLLVAAALPVIFGMIPDWGVRAPVLLLLAASAGGLAFAATADYLPRRLAGLLPMTFIQSLSVGLRRILLSPRWLGLTVILGLANQIGGFVVVALLARALNLPITWVQCLAVAPIALLMTALPISVGGWGVREGAFVAGFNLVGVPASDALALSVVFGLVMMVVRLPGGLIWFAVGDNLPKSGRRPPCGPRELRGHQR
jgi:glycosyltransferase 2 family protein